MKLEEIEKLLKDRRQTYYSDFKKNITGSRSLQPLIVENIESGKNYRLVSLLKYIKALDLNLYANNIRIEELNDLGISVKNYRKQNQYTQFDMMIKCQFNPNKIIRLEKGQGSRNTLKTICDIFPDFELEIKE